MGRKIKELYSNRRVQVAILIALLLVLAAIGFLIFNAIERPKDVTPKISFLLF